MKAYKKLATLAPIAVLSTSILFSPAMTFAAEKTTSIPMKSTAIQTSHVAATSGFNLEQFKQDIRSKFLEKAKQDYPGYTPDESSLQINGLDDISFTYVNSGNISIDAQVNQYKDAGNIELLSYRNETPVNQTQKMNGNTITHTETSTVSNTEGTKIGLATESKLSVSVPFVAEGGETVKTTTDFDYSHTSTNTTTDTRTETFPEQSVVCVPNATTVYTGIVRTAEFSGSYTGAAMPSGTITATVNVSNGSETLRAEYGAGGDIASGIFDKNNLPSYLEYQDGKGVLVKNMTTTFTGTAGHQQIVQAKTYPINSSQASKTVEMSLQDFKDPQIRTAKLAQLQK